MWGMLDNIIARIICSLIFGCIWTMIMYVIVYIIKCKDISNNNINIMIISNSILIFLCLLIFYQGN